MFDMIVGQYINTNLNAGSIFVSLIFPSATKIFEYLDSNVPIICYQPCAFSEKLWRAWGIDAVERATLEKVLTISLGKNLTCKSESQD